MYAQGGDDDYEFSPDHFDDPYTPEELAQVAAATAKVVSDVTA